MSTQIYCLFASQMQILYIYSLIESAVGTPLTGWAAARLERVGRLRHLIDVKFLYLLIKMTINIYVSKLMHNFKIGFKFVKLFF